jgi:DNA-binding transcriptional MerR regulator
MEKTEKATASQSSPARSGAGGLLLEEEIGDIERQSPDGLTSRQIVDVFTSRGLRFSEATLRKYVQLGLLPRSVRVGRKGRHRGSCGIYPAEIVRRVNQVRVMMAADLTIAEIQRSFARFKEEIERVEKGVRELIAGFEREAKGPSLDPDRPRSSPPSRPPESSSVGSREWKQAFKLEPVRRRRALPSGVAANFSSAGPDSRTRNDHGRRDY